MTNAQRSPIHLPKAIERLRAAMALLTRLPMGSLPQTSIPWGTLAPYYPWVGFILGLILAIGAAAMNRLSPGTPLLNAALLIVAWVGLTGALHLDGWGDCADALWTPVAPARRLEIMADPRIGGFGAIGLILLLLLKTAALTQIMAQLLGVPGIRGWGAALLPVVLAPVVGRMAAVLVLLDSEIPNARPTGMGFQAREELSENAAWTSLVAAFLLTLIGLQRGLAMVVIGSATGWSFARWASRRLEGMTGDVLGAVIELSETAALIAAVWGR